MAYTNRVDYAEDGDECKLSDECQLIDGHGGDCDSRSEQERWAALRAQLFKAGGLLDCPDCGPGSGTLTPGRLHEQGRPGSLVCAACGEVVEEPNERAVKLAEEREREYQRKRAQDEIVCIVEEDRAAQRPTSYTEARLAKAYPGEQHVARSTWARYCRVALAERRHGPLPERAQLTLPIATPS